MIHTLTLNPALDYIIRLEKFNLNQKNMIYNENIRAGGKGINVSQLLNNLDEKSHALAFVGGFTGKILESFLRDYKKIKTDFVYLSDEMTRINVKIKEKTNKETEINALGPKIKEEEIKLLFEKLEKIENGDYLFLSGSIPKSLKDDFYGKIMERLKEKKIKIIVDGSGKVLKKSLSQKPYLIKPNLSELEGVFGVKIKDEDDLRFYAKKLQKMGALNIIVSLAKKGAYMLSSDEEYFMKAKKGKLIDSVGAGDSMLAGFIYAMKNGFSKKEAFKFSIACGSASAFSKNIAKKETIFALYEQV